MIIDTPALVAILYGEPEAADCVRRIHDAAVCRISGATDVELSMVDREPNRPRRNAVS